MELPFSERTRTQLKRAALLLWIAAIGYIVISRGLEMDWPKVLEALRSFEATTMVTAFALGVPAFLACASFDLIGRHVTGHRLPVPRVMLISWTGYFFSLNLGALVGGLAFRYRLYMPYRLSGMTISQVIGLSIVTNWSGYVPIAGAVLAWQPPDLPAAWGVREGVMRGTGILLLAVSAGYLALCALRGGSRVSWKDSKFELPTLKTAAMQVALSVVSWGSIGAIITWLIPGDLSWFTVMPVLMISAIAGIWSHVPSGLGVIELVFLALLGHRVPHNELLAAILMYRLVYYLVPFGLAILAYAWLEATARRAYPAAE
jgi:glycosyltransferase 2 family protein